MIPYIAYDFNFDYVLILMFTSYIVYGYFSGGHKQIRFSINLILPFVIIYYLGRYITSFMYIPLSKTFLFEMLNTGLFSGMKNTIGMIMAYIITYILLFASIFIFSIYARRYILNENMRAKLGKKNNYLGAIVALINGYVLIYFILLPVFSFNIIGSEAVVTNFVLENPPPFSRIARTAEKAVPIKALADKANEFQQLISVEGVEGYYNDAIYDSQQSYLGEDSYERDFMVEIYSELSTLSKTLIDDEYFDYFGEVLSINSFQGVSRVLLVETTTNDFLYEDILDIEDGFESVVKEMKSIVDDYEDALLEYDKDNANYIYGIEYENYLDLLEVYEADALAFTILKINTILAGNTFDLEFEETRPSINLEEPSNYNHSDNLVEPVEPILTSEISDAYTFADNLGDRKDITPDLRSLGANFKDHEGLIIWYVDVLDRNMSSTASGGDISETIVSFKINYEDIRDNINDEELENKLYLANMSIISYDVFSTWLECTLDNMDNITLEELQLEEYRCNNIDTSSITEYDFTNDALDLVSTLFEGDSVTWIILQYKYDYEAGAFNDVFAEYPEIKEVLENTKELVDDYDMYYKDIATSLDGNISMIFKIGISVMKYHIDVYDTLENTPILSAMFNDMARMCSNEGSSEINRDVFVCSETAGSSGIIGEFFNAQFLISDIVFKAYIMVDEDNELIIYDSLKMSEFLSDINDSVENNVITKEVVNVIANQLAFNIIDSTNNYTILEQMYDEGQITIEAMRILANDEYDLFSIEFTSRVRSLIR